MSAMVLSSVRRFIEMSPMLEELGIRNIHFYDAQNDGGLDHPVVALVPFVDCVVLGKDTNLSGQLSRVVEEAFARHIPVLSEDCLHEMKNFCG